MEVEIIRYAVYQRNVSPRYPSCWSIEAIIDAHLQTPDIEIVEITVEWSIAISRLQMAVVLLPEPFAKEISDMSKDYQDQVADIGCKEVVVRGLVH